MSIAEQTTVEALGEDLRSLVASAGHRVIVGICGPPGTGKSTTARVLCDVVGSDRAVVVQLDGFHLASTIIDGTELAARRGAIDTFDSASFAVLVERLRAADEDVVYAPTFERELEEPINASLAVERRHDLVIVEGNYLLADGRPWERVRRCLDETWYLHTDPELRVPRLVARHVATGKPPAVAADWVERSDEVNARLVAATMHRADRVISIRQDVPGRDPDVEGPGRGW